mgnify:CR=1 FL=1|tara:strand:+ start:556 stop:888 length:333 start_codon:yes stop_codon:yes gene_type:complete
MVKMLNIKQPKESKMARKEKLLDELLKECKSPEDILGEGGLLKQLTKSLVERALEGEMTDHLRYQKHSPLGKTKRNSRNGKSAKTIKGKNGDILLGWFWLLCHYKNSSNY